MEDSTKQTPPTAPRQYFISAGKDACTVTAAGELHAAFKQLIVRGAGLWPDAPWQLKEMVDMIVEGKPMQNYEALYNRPSAAAQQAQAVKTVAQEHADMVQQLAKSGAAILSTMTSEKMDLIHGAVGISGEAGELLDAVKKHCVYNKSLDRENVIEELGDMEFYMQMVRANLGITRNETLHANIEKLAKKRYKDGYSDAAAQARADKVTVTSGLEQPEPVAAQQSHPSSQSPSP